MKIMIKAIRIIRDWVGLRLFEKPNLQLYSAEILNGEVIIRSQTDKSIVWIGKPKGYDVKQVVPLKDNDDFIVILEFNKVWEDKQKNLLRINPEGDIIWEVGDPQKGNLFSSLRDFEVQIYTGITSMRKDHIIAYAWSGFSDTIDIATGAVIKSDFVK